MPAHSFLISSAQGLPACATAAEPDSSSAVNMTNPDRIPATLDFSVEIQKGISEYIRRPASVHAMESPHVRICWDEQLHQNPSFNRSRERVRSSWCATG